MRSILKKSLGYALILVGFLALVTPLTPGSWLIFVGLELIGIRYAFDPESGWGKWLANVGVKSREKK